MKNIDEKREFLLNYYQKYKAFSLKEIDEIIEHYEYFEVEKNEHLQENGEFSKYTYLVIKGMLINYTYDYNGNKVVLNFIPEKYWAGGGEHYNLKDVNIQAVELTQLFKIKSTTLETLYENNDKYAFTEVRLIRNAFKSLKLRMFNNVSKPTIYNYEQLLKKFPNIEQRVPQKYIASYLGVTPQFFSKMKNDFIKNNQ
ncbi:Crp/Fnr family transcriptional regulator [uncultured Aquimarina sp.]|uniref:Crp/Fnr family transcriptional regulator n=1 Tax=uncultured Aquimarina sp. TaxID=575652 RepID=UPI002611BF7A|nr:Crp/Fnr family transcriptional regulator [uncultured Aquimarina sp.]